MIAISAGIDYAKGDHIVLMDSDGQDPPQEIANLYHKAKQGFDVVYAKRISRGKEGILKKWTAKWFYKLLGRITNIPIPMDVGDFRIMSRKVNEALKQMPEKQRISLKKLISKISLQRKTWRMGQKKLLPQPEED